MFPTTSETVNRIVGAKFSPSKSSGNPMVEVNTEVVTPEEVEIGGEMITISGVKATNYFVTTVFIEDKVTVDEEKTEKSRENFKAFYSKLGLDPSTINWDNVDTKPLLGILTMTQMESETEERRKTPTLAQIEAAKSSGKRVEGDIMKNPVTGKPLVNYWPKIREFFGAAPSDGVNVAY